MIQLYSLQSGTFYNLFSQIATNTAQKAKPSSSTMFKFCLWFRCNKRTLDVTELLFPLITMKKVIIDIQWRSQGGLKGLEHPLSQKKEKKEDITS